LKFIFLLSKPITRQNKVDFENYIQLHIAECGNIDKIFEHYLSASNILFCSHDFQHLFKDLNFPIQIIK